MANVSMFDIISLALVLILGIKGIINGFVKEVFGLFRHYWRYLLCFSLCPYRWTND